MRSLVPSGLPPVGALVGTGCWLSLLSLRGSHCRLPLEMSSQRPEQNHTSGPVVILLNSVSQGQPGSKTETSPASQWWEGSGLIITGQNGHRKHGEEQVREPS